MKRTVQEKYEYNKARAGLFSCGYCFGVTLYRDYLKSDEEMRRVTKEFFATANESASGGEEFSKGIMCAVRDCAAERKAAQNAAHL